MKLFSQNFDLFHFDLSSAPEFVKTASIVTQEQAKALPDTAFALIVMEKSASQRMLPVFDKAHTWFSVRDLSEKLEGMPKKAAAIAARNVCTHADARGIEVPEKLRKIAATAGATQTRYYQASDTDFSFGFPEQEGIAKEASITVKGRVMPIRNATELGRAEEWFQRNHTKMASADKYRMATFIASQRVNLLPNEKTASDRNQLRSSEVTKVASLNCYNPGLRQALYKRASMATDTASFKSYVTLAENLKVASFGGPAALIDTLEGIDYRAGLQNHYRTWIEEPIYAVLSKSASAAKTAEEKQEIMNYVDERNAEALSAIMGRPISVREIKRSAGDGALRRLLGDSLANQLVNDPDRALASLPDDVKRVIASHLAKT